MVFILVLLGLYLPLRSLAQDSNLDLRAVLDRFDRTVKQSREYCINKWEISPKVAPIGKVTAIGSAIDSNCFKTGTADSDKLLKKVNELQALAIKQATKCKAIYNSESLNKLIDEAIKSIQEAKYTCPIRKGNIAASASIKGFGNKKIKEIVISDFNRLGRPSELSPIGPNYDRGFNDDSHEGAAILFHEGLHFTESGNTQWHNHSEKKNSEGCSNSLFEDRVYFIEAACFPLTARGRNLFIQKTGDYKNPSAKYSAADCPTICQSAFQNVNTSKMRDLMEIFGRDSGKAKPLPADEVKNICHNILEVRDFYRNFIRPADINANLAAVLKTPSKLAKVVENKEAIEDIKRKVEDLSKLRVSIYSARETGDLLRVFSLIQDNLVQLKARIADVCSQTKESGTSICATILEVVAQNETMIKKQMALMTSSDEKNQKLTELLSDY